MSTAIGASFSYDLSISVVAHSPWTDSLRASHDEVVRVPLDPVRLVNDPTS